MSRITVGTTPTIKYTFSIVSPSDFTKVVLTIKKGKTTIIEKDLEDATIGEDYVSWKLTQSETLSLGNAHVSMMINWLTSDGTRGASDITIIDGVDNHIREVM